jgi:hypothetical protein
MTRPVYQIHPGIGIARLGNSSTDFYLAPEATGALPTDCDNNGNPSLDANGHEEPVSSFKDDQGRIKRQAARFRVYVYDDANPGGRELKIGDQIQGLDSHGKLVDIQWTVYMANKKATWFQFKELEGEHGYAADHPRRNATITDPDSRLQLVIDPGPQTVNCTTQIMAELAVGKNPNYTQNFPPPLQPNSIQTLGQIMTNGDNHLLVLGGFGNSGCLPGAGGPGGPVIRSYANNDGWFDDIADGPVMAILKYHSDEDDEDRYLNVQDPAWVLVGYPRFAPQIVDLITIDEVIYDLGVREFAYNTYLYGTGNFDAPESVDPADANALKLWRAAEKQWNSNYYPYFWKDVWAILSRPDRLQWVTDVLAISSDPHETGPGGNFDQSKISIPPKCKNTPECAGSCEGDCMEDPYRAMRQYIYNMLRKPGEENLLTDTYHPERTGGRPLMPLLNGDNPLSNTLTSKFLRLTDTQLYVLKQWADGKFINEKLEGFDDSTIEQPHDAGVALDRGVMGNLLGGSFCPGGELGWIVRNPDIYVRPYRLRVNPAYIPSAGSGRSSLSAPFSPPPLSLDPPVPVGSTDLVIDDISAGLEPGDLTKREALPWQADFNECSTQDVDVTYVTWAKLPPATTNLTMPTLWWPAHRPMQVYREVPHAPDQAAHYKQIDWARGIPETNQGDLKMVTAWPGLGFVVANSQATPENQEPLYIEVEAQDDTY